MIFLRIFFVLGILLFAMPSWAQDDASPSDDEDAKMAQLLQAGAKLASSGKPNEAIEFFDKVAASYEEKYRDSKSIIFCSRWLAETLVYLGEAAVEKKGDAKVVSANWVYAYYLKAYFLLDIGRVSEAKVLLERAIALSPRNSQFLSELGNVYQREKNWPMATKTFKLAESAAREFSPPNVRDIELSKAWRGIAYVLVEQNQLDDAEKIYRQCIDLNKNDTRALSELRYVLSLKAKQSFQ